MSDLIQMLQVQSRLHTKQGANALGDLFNNAAKEIERLTERLENPRCLQELVCVEQMKEMTMLEIHRANQNLHEQLAKANERIEELQDALVDDSKAKAMLNKLAMENGELNIKASGNIFHVFCSTFVETFKESGATNYLVAEFNHEEFGAFTVTMQRSEGLTVYQKLNEANERVKELKADILNAIGAIEREDDESLYDANCILSSSLSQLRKEQEHG